MVEKDLEVLINDARNKSEQTKTALGLLLNVYFLKSKLESKDESYFLYSYKTIKTLLELVFDLVLEVADKTKDAGELRDSSVEGNNE